MVQELGQPTDSESVGRTVAMLVLNDITADGRVKKTAATVAALGSRVTLIGYSSTSRRIGHIGGIPAIWVKDEGTFRRLSFSGWRSSRDFGVTGSLVAGIDRVRGWRRLTPERYTVRRSKLKLALRYLTPPERPSIIGGDAATVALQRLSWLRLKNSFRLRRRLLQRRITKLDLAYAEQHRTIAVESTNVARERWAMRANARAAVYSRKGRLDDWELAFGPELDRLSPDVVHVHDVYLLGVACRYKRRQVAKGRDISVVYDAHEYMAGTLLAADASNSVLVELERQYISSADRVITVSPMIKEWLLRDHEISETSVTVILNTPPPVARDSITDETVRNVVALADDVPLIVYSGGISEVRGVGDLVQALAELPGVHCVLVAPPGNLYARRLMNEAVSIGVADRLHIADFVPSERVTHFLSGADVAVHPLRRRAQVGGHAEVIENHEAALPNKLFEYLHAGLPVVVSDCRAMSEFVTDNAVGVTFVAGEPAALAEAIRDALRRRDQIRKAITSDLIEQFTWTSQADRLQAVYSGLAGQVTPAASDEALTKAVEDQLSLMVETSAEIVKKPKKPKKMSGAESLLIGPLNTAGQAYRWAVAVEEAYGGSAESERLQRSDSLGFQAHRSIFAGDYDSLGWQIRRLDSLPKDFSHILAESGWSPLGSLNGGRIVHDIPFLTRHGIQCGIVLHGSEARDPHRHASRERYSPFHGELSGLTQKLARAAAEMRTDLSHFGGQVFCTTPDLLSEYPGSAWLPVVVDARFFLCENVPRHAERLRVLFAPSRSALKGTSEVEAILESMSDSGEIDYRRLDGVSHDEVLREVQHADVVVDQLLLGAYGVAAVEALAAGRIVLGHVSESVRRSLPDEPPIIEANPGNFEEALRTVIDNRESCASAAAEDGPAFARTFHDGRLAAQQLRDWMNGSDLPVVPSLRS